MLTHPATHGVKRAARATLRAIGNAFLGFISVVGSFARLLYAAIPPVCVLLVTDLLFRCVMVIATVPSSPCKPFTAAASAALLGGPAFSLAAATSSSTAGCQFNAALLPFGLNAVVRQILLHDFAAIVGLVLVLSGLSQLPTFRALLGDDE
jgi:hypothetical protein